MRDLLEQHEAYNLPALCNFIHLRYPTIPVTIVPHVVHAACEGAKYASQMYLVQRSYAGSERTSLSQRTITPIYNFSADALPIPSIKPQIDLKQLTPTEKITKDHLQELEVDIVARALTMNGIDSLLDADDGILEDLIGQQSTTFGDDLVLDVEVMTQDALNPPENPELEPTTTIGKAQPPATDFTKIHDKKRARHESQEAMSSIDQEARVAVSNLEVTSHASETKKPRKERDDNDTGIQPERNNGKREESNDFNSQQREEKSKEETTNKKDNVKKSSKNDSNEKEVPRDEDNAKKRDVSKNESSPKNQSKERNSEKVTSTKEMNSKTQLKTNSEQRETPSRPKITSNQRPAVKSSVEKKQPNEEGHEQRDTVRNQPRRQDDKRQPESRSTAEHTRNWKPRFGSRHTSYERNESRRSRERSPSPVYVPRSMMDEFKRFMRNKNRK